MNVLKIKPATRTAVAGIFLAIILAVSLVAAETKRSRAATQAAMQQKLAYSQAILEGLALEKFDLVSKNALRMKEMTQSSFWFVIKQPDYMQYTTNFYKSLDSLYLAAVDKNLDLATEAYMKVARNCVECHRTVRTEQRKSAGTP